MFGLIGKNLSNQLTLSEIIQKISTNPREIAVQEQIKIEEGQEANITLFDPDIKWEVKKSDIKSKSINTPFIGEEMKGKAVAICNNNQFNIIE